MFKLFNREKKKIAQKIISAGSFLNQQFLAHIIDELPGVIFVKDVQDDYRICLINREAENFFSLTREQMIGKKDDELFAREEADFFHSVDINVMQSGKIMDVPCERLTTKQGVMLLHTRKVPIYDQNGEPRYLLGLAQDITERVRSEQELLSYKEKLEQKVCERTKKLTEAIQKAEEGSRLKSEFLATMSHEIRSPMSGVLGMAELLLETQQTVEQANLTRTIINCGEALLNVIEDILDFSKIEANRMEINPVPVNMHELVDDICALYAPKAREKALEIVVRYVPGTEQFVYADPVRVRQVLSNLINNAIKFTKKGHIVVTVQERRTEKDKADSMILDFSIQDTGIGIAPEEREVIFEKFSQCDSSATRDYGGTGLGLSISKRLAQLMEGDITLESQLGSGSVFTFSLPAKRNTRDVYIQFEPPSLNNIRILVVDDLPVVCELVKEQLSLVGMKVDTCNCGKTALVIMERAASEGEPYHIALIDYLMPQMNGEILARAINDIPSIRDTCLIMMTAAGNPIVGDNMARKGFSAYVSKPLRHNHLVDILSYVWNQYKEGKKDTLIRVDTLSFGKDVQPEDKLRLDGKLILLVEDSRINQAFVQEVLENMGGRLIVTSNGKEALQALKSNPDISLVLMDCQMPVMDGFEATRKIMKLKKKNEVRTSLPIIALTANAMEGDREKCIEAGMNDYISKPVRRKDLKKSVYRWLVENNEEEAQPLDDDNASNRSPLLDMQACAEAQRIFSGKYEIILTYFREDGEKYILEIERAIKRKNIESVVRPVHTLKSNSRGMGAARLSDMCRDMEIKAKAMAENRLDTSWSELAHDLEAVKKCFFLTCDVLFKENDQSSAREA